MKYIYPAIFTPNEDAIFVDFPDIPHCCANGATIEEAFENAENALALTLYEMEKEKRKILPPTSIDKLKVPAGSYAALVKADTLPVHKMNTSYFVQKSVTLPKWMDSIAQEKNIDFSQLLQNAICRECGLNT